MLKKLWKVASQVQIPERLKADGRSGARSGISRFVSFLREPRPLGVAHRNHHSEEGMVLLHPGARGDPLSLGGGGSTN